MVLEDATEKCEGVSRKHLTEPANIKSLVSLPEISECWPRLCLLAPLRFPVVCTTVRMFTLIYCLLVWGLVSENPERTCSCSYTASVSLSKDVKRITGFLNLLLTFYFLP